VSFVDSDKTGNDLLSAVARRQDEIGIKIKIKMKP
jgi:hypothetical protein